ncbi:MAG: hypothetical protein Ct9H300mP28_00660 [Pseudomonadota bacterium]|nr:MAG: hypothetical protein Ct9H300mP28_00660 [Pseudomonadota bacterium]
MDPGALGSLGVGTGFAMAAGLATRKKKWFASMEMVPLA